MPPNLAEQVLNLRIAGQFAAIKTPSAAQDAGGNVKQAIAFAMAGIGVIQQSRRFFVHRDSAANGRHPIDLGEKAVIPIARVARLKPPDIGDGDTGGPFGLHVIFGIKLDLARGTHRLEGLAA
jgi:hypothetical protein